MNLLNRTARTAVLLIPLLLHAPAGHAETTRAAVRAELARLEQAGYEPALREPLDFPADIMAAQARLAAAAPAPASAPATAAPAGSVGGAGTP
ncbi:DUF4148 domain-containing protein [Burkholderia plantarii]|uniref:DUF4148 domain-containing protein n=1 Tax=Burkholderia plantarii TaxID=41899 RepID=UPI0018DD21C5|nr:DUF4148 domain-containing protein [Burkholderia plantarii]MBI0331105.1 DUF4148 domain-containing protein [Burkholderia plantarii]